MDWAELEGCITTKELERLMDAARDAGYPAEPDALVPGMTYKALREMYPNTTWED